jgi:anti-sigma28 factor (negative regulator of flagellin synthesis)
MRINNNVPLSPIADSQGRVERQEQPANAPGDQIQLSGTAVSAAASQAEKLAALRAQVANGSYRVSSDSIANSMMYEMMREGSE